MAGGNRAPSLRVFILIIGKLFVKQKFFQMRNAEFGLRNEQTHDVRLHTSSSSSSYSERQKQVDLEWEVIANEVKQSHKIAASLRSSQ
jgi:hypothetical protein